MAHDVGHRLELVPTQPVESQQILPKTKAETKTKKHGIAGGENIARHTWFMRGGVHASTFATQQRRMTRACWVTDQSGMGVFPQGGEGEGACSFVADLRFLHGCVISLGAPGNRSYSWLYFLGHHARRQTTPTRAAIRLSNMCICLAVHLLPGQPIDNNFNFRWCRRCHTRRRPPCRTFHSEQDLRYKFFPRRATCVLLSLDNKTLE